MAITDFRSLRRFTGVNVIAACPALRVAAIAAIHAAALLAVCLTEYGPFATTLALLTWAFLNFFWLILLRRPAVAAALSLVMIVSMIGLFLFKYDILEMTLSFFDVLVVDADTVAFLLTIFPDLRPALAAAAIVAVPLLILLWRLDPFRLRRRTSSFGAAVSLAGMAGLASMVPGEAGQPFSGVNHISNFARSGVVAVSELMGHGFFEADAATADRLKPLSGETCRPASKPPHIIMVLDESSFDITAAPGIKVPPGYADHFRSFDGKARSLLVGATGGPSWYSEYNVLTGLSARSYGRFIFNVTRIAAGRVERGLPQALRRCGYRTFSLYPAYGAFLGARRFQTGTGVEHFSDLKEIGATSNMQPDRFYFDQALRVIERERGEAPLFIFVYVAANHFPWTSTFRPDLESAVRLPYQDYLSYVAQHPEQECKLDEMRVLIDEPALVPDFKYVSEQLTDDHCLALLYKLKRAIALVEEHGIADPGDALTKLDDYIEEIWARRGLYPGLGSVVSVLADLAEGEPRKES